ncbi:MAG: tetratricopeptide repeat protein [Leptolyngbya sp. SIO4C1]|nr:tetratricopeptide repeat protein [Leptolyngbya sp. SIO4C1]
MLGITVPCLVQPTRKSETALNVQLFLEQQPTRQTQKIKTLGQYIQQHPTGWKKRLELAELLYKEGRWARAIEEYHQVIARQPRLIQTRLKVGKLLQMLGQAAEAIETYKQILPLCRHLATKQHIQGLISACSEEPTKAVRAFESAASLEPNNAAHWLALGQIQMSMQHEAAALAAFDRILQLQPDDLVALTHSHDALWALGEFEAAQVRLNQAEALAPCDYAVLKRQLAHRLRMKWIYGKAGKQTKQIMTAAVKLAPHSAEAHRLKAEYYCLREEWQKAQEIWQQFTAEYKQNPQGWYYYALFLLDKTDKQEAVKAISQAHQLDPQNLAINQALHQISPAE